MVHNSYHISSNYRQLKLTKTIAACSKRRESFLRLDCRLDCLVALVIDVVVWPVLNFEGEIVRGLLAKGREVVTIAVRKGIAKTEISIAGESRLLAQNCLTSW